MTCDFRRNHRECCFPDLPPWDNPPPHCLPLASPCCLEFVQFPPQFCCFSASSVYLGTDPAASTLQKMWQLLPAHLEMFGHV